MYQQCFEIRWQTTSSQSWSIASHKKCHVIQESWKVTWSPHNAEPCLIKIYIVWNKFCSFSSVKFSMSTWKLLTYFTCCSRQHFNQLNSPFMHWAWFMCSQPSLISKHVFPVTTSMQCNSFINVTFSRYLSCLQCFHTQITKGSASPTIIVKPFPLPQPFLLKSSVSNFLVSITSLGKWKTLRLVGFLSHIS